MKIIFGPYGSLLSGLGIPTDAAAIKREGLQHDYHIAIEKIAKQYIDAGATLPTVHSFFLRTLLHDGLEELYKEMLRLSLKALLSAMQDQSFERFALTLGPAFHGYRPELAPSAVQAEKFARRQYELCLEVLWEFAIPLAKVVFLHETIGTGREALGISRAARSLQIPLIVSFVVDREGRLLSGETVEQATLQIDGEIGTFIEGYALNCCSPLAFGRVFENWQNQTRWNRIIGFYPNSYDSDPCFYETGKPLEPNKCDSLKIVVDQGNRHRLKFIGGCCGFQPSDLQMLMRLCIPHPS